MTNAPISSRRVKPPRAPLQGAHLYKVGQAVRLKSGFWPTGDTYLITATLPPRGDSPQYRIRNEEERFERVTTQDNIEDIAPPPVGDDAALIEKSFGPGQSA